MYNIGISLSDCWIYLQLSVAATFVQALQKNNSAVVKEFLDKMNAPALVQSLVLNELIPDRVEYAIKHLGKRDANGHLLKYMKEDADEETIQRILKEASVFATEREMNKFAAAYLCKYNVGVCLFDCWTYLQLSVSANFVKAHKLLAASTSVYNAHTLSRV